MPFTTGNIAAMTDALKAAAGALLAAQEVDLYNGATVSVRLHVNTRSANTSDLTGGAVQEAQMIATIDADDWDAKAGRMPQKGDVIHWAGKRYAVDRAHVAAPGGDRAFYKARLEG